MKNLFTRVLLHGLTVLFVSTAVFVGLGLVLVRPAFERNLWELGRLLAPQVCRDLSSLEKRREPAPQLIATVYSAKGELLGSFVTPPVPPLSTEDVARLRTEKVIALSGKRAIHAFWCEDVAGGAYVELGPPPPPSVTGGLALPFALAVLVVAVASVPFARSIARPIAELVRVAHALGEGQLAARTKIARRDEVGELARAFNQMADRLQRLIVAEKELLANVSHELRTPLARIRVVLETALENPKRAESLLQEIGTDLGDLERLVETIMETMRLDLRATELSPGALPIRLEPTDIVAVVRDAAERFRSLYPEHRVELELEEPSLLANADPRLLRRLLENLLDNAHKYCESSAPISVRVPKDPEPSEFVRIEVLDRGMGIDRADLPHVFEPFFRGDRSRSRATGGAGLGLALAKKIAIAHAGQIVVKSEIGVGTTVEVAVPRSRRPTGEH